MQTKSSSAELKASARQKLLGKYSILIGAFLIVEVLTSVISFAVTELCGFSSISQIVIYYLIMILLSLFSSIFVSGQIYMYLNVSCGRPVVINDVFHGFKFHPEKAILIELFLMIITALPAIPAAVFYALWKTGMGTGYIIAFSAFTCVAIVVIVMLSLTYSQAFYLMYDFPQYTVKQLLKTSRRKMKGNKGRFFYMNVSFIPLILLGILSFGIGFLWIAPYITETQTEFFLDMMQGRSTSSAA